MSRRPHAIVYVTVAVFLVAVALAAGACSGDSSSGGISTGGGSPSPSATVASPSESPSAGESPFGSPEPSVSPSESEAPDDSGGGSSSGDLSADEFNDYAEAVAPWYDEIVQVGGEITYIMSQVDSNEISMGQGARRIERQLWKLDPPVTELASVNEPDALSEAHTAWLDAISYEANAYARVVELMRAGKYQRGATDSQVEDLWQKATDGYTEWRETLQQYEQDLGVQVPWGWPE